MDARTALIAKIRPQQLSTAGLLPTVSLEDFFSENYDSGSIGCNLAQHPGPQEFFRVLQEIRSRPDVQDVLVAVSEVVEQDRETWPFSDTVYIFASAGREDVTNWVAVFSQIASS